jgi:hypothetical protein
MWVKISRHGRKSVEKDENHAVLGFENGQYRVN